MLIRKGHKVLELVPKWRPNVLDKVFFLKKDNTINAVYFYAEIE